MDIGPQNIIAYRQEESIYADFGCTVCKKEYKNYSIRSVNLSNFGVTCDCVGKKQICNLSNFKSKEEYKYLMISNRDLFFKILEEVTHIISEAEKLEIKVNE